MYNMNIGRIDIRVEEIIIYSLLTFLQSIFIPVYQFFLTTQ